MALETLLDHKCDIHHMTRAASSPGYGLPAAPNFSYPETPDIASVPCHFNVRSGTIAVVQREPQANLEGKTKLTLPAGTDVRINDKVMDTTHGVEYTAELPQNIRGHHIVVNLRRTGQQEPL